MKFLKYVICLLIVSMALVSCENIETPSKQENNNADFYYVKYSISSPGVYKYFSDIYYADVDGTGSASINYSIKNWTITVGPVKKGFNAFVRNKKGEGNNMIEVSKNNSPFAIKASGLNEASYKITY